MISSGPPRATRLEQIFARAYRELRPRAPIPPLDIRFYPFTGINNTIRLREGQMLVRVSDLLEGASDPVLHAIAHILLAKLYRKPIVTAHATRYRRYISSQDVASKTHLIRQMRGRKNMRSARGAVYDLEQIFEDLNKAFFHGLLARPALTWSSNHSRYSLGHYDPAHNTIVVSRAFDREHVPAYAVEYLLYHEMLHLKHPVKLRGSRRCVHSAAFQEEERLFPQLQQAKEFLKKL